MGQMRTMVEGAGASPSRRDRREKGQDDVNRQRPSVTVGEGQRGDAEFCVRPNNDRRLSS
jgi:hypothetical protein